jgi:hypothetical protein
MKVGLDIINNQQCNEFFEDAKLDNGIIGSQLCAGVLEGLKDTCNGGEMETFNRMNTKTNMFQTLVVHFKSPQSPTFAFITSLA